MYVGETLEAYIHIQFPPMYAYRADFILLAFRFWSFQQILVPILSDSNRFLLYLQSNITQNTNQTNNEVEITTE